MGVNALVDILEGRSHMDEESDALNGARRLRADNAQSQNLCVVPGR